MFTHYKEALARVAEKVRGRYGQRIVLVRAFGSRVRGDHRDWSDFDVLVVVRSRDHEIERGIVDAFVEEEMAGGIVFSPVIKDEETFRREMESHTPFYENVMGRGVTA